MVRLYGNFVEHYQIKMIRPVSGIAMGLITDGDRYAVLLLSLVMKIT
jgi:hypothetical protein